MSDSSDYSDGKGHLTVMDKQIIVIENYFELMSSSNSSYKSALSKLEQSSSYKSALNDLEQSLSEPRPEVENEQEQEQEQEQEIPNYAKDIYNKRFTISGNLMSIGYEISIVIHGNNTLDFVIKLKGHSYIFKSKLYTDLNFLNDTQPNIDILGNKSSPELVFTIRNCTFTTKLVRGNNCEIVIDEPYKVLIDLIIKNIRPNLKWGPDKLAPKTISIGDITYDNTHKHIILIAIKDSNIEENILTRGTKRKSKKKSIRKKTRRKKSIRKKTRRKTRRKKITKKRKTKKKRSRR